MTLDVAMAETLLDMGLELEEVAADLGCDVAALERALAGKVPVPTAVPLIERAGGHSSPPSFPAPGTRTAKTKPPGSHPNVTKGVSMDSSMGRIAKLDHTLIAWSSQHEDRIVALCDDMNGAGRPAAVKVHGRSISRAGLTRLIAERTSELHLRRPLYQASDRQQELLVKFAALSVLALDAIEKEAPES